MELLYLEDSYLRECDAEVQSLEEGRYVILDRTIFHPEERGQPSDAEEIIMGDGSFRVVYVAWWPNISRGG